MKLRSVILFIVLASLVPTSLSYAQSPTEISQTPTPTKKLIEPPITPESGIDLTLSPIFINLLTKPSRSVTSQVKIKNNSNIEEYLFIDLARFEASQDGSQPVLVDIQETDEFQQWITFVEPEFVLAPNQTKTLRFTITPPETAGLGYYYALVFKRIQEKDQQTSGATVSGAPAISILLEVESKKSKREIQLVDFMSDKLFYEYLPTEFHVKLKNTGNIHIIPTGDIFIDWGNRKDVGTIQVNEASGNILPQSERTYKVIWDDAMILRKPTDGANGQHYSTFVDFDKPLRTFRIGKYTGHLLLIYDNGERDVPLEAQVSFWVIPWKLLLGIIFLMLLPIIILLSFKRFKRRK